MKPLSRRSVKTDMSLYAFWKKSVSTQLVCLMVDSSMPQRIEVCHYLVHGIRRPTQATEHRAMSSGPNTHIDCETTFTRSRELKSRYLNAIRCPPPQSVVAPSGECLRGKAGMVFVAGKTVWSMPERFKVVCIPCNALYKCSALLALLYLEVVAASSSRHGATFTIKAVNHVDQVDVWILLLCFNVAPRRHDTIVILQPAPA